METTGDIATVSHQKGPPSPRPQTSLEVVRTPLSGNASNFPEPAHGQLSAMPDNPIEALWREDGSHGAAEDSGMEKTSQASMNELTVSRQNSRGYERWFSG